MPENERLLEDRALDRLRTLARWRGAIDYKQYVLSALEAQDAKTYPIGYAEGASAKDTEWRQVADLRADAGWSAGYAAAHAEWRERLRALVAEAHGREYKKSGEVNGCKCVTCVAIYELCIAGSEEVRP